MAARRDRTPRATSTLRLVVPARAMVTHAVVASPPFFWNMAQSACGTIADKILREIDHDLAGAVETVAERGLRLRRRLDFGMAVAEQHRSPAAHEVDIFAPVDVADPASLRAREKLRIAFRQPRRVEMPPHPAGHDAGRPRPQGRVRGLGFVEHRGWVGHDLPHVDVRVHSLTAVIARSTSRRSNPSIHRYRCEMDCFACARNDADGLSRRAQPVRNHPIIIPLSARPLLYMGLFSIFFVLAPSSPSPAAAHRGGSGVRPCVSGSGDACRDAEKISHVTMNMAAIRGPMTKPLRPNTWMPPSVEISTT